MREKKENVLSNKQSYFCLKDSPIKPKIQEGKIMITLRLLLTKILEFEGEKKKKIYIYIYTHTHTHTQEYMVSDS